MKTFLFRGVAIFAAVLLVAAAAQAQRGQFLTAEEFRDQTFAEALPYQALWINKEQRAQVENILDHSFRGLRIRYWGRGEQTAWIFEEIGKELPITVGVSVDGSGIVGVSILEYRESRGGEVRYPFFTSQFKGLELVEKDQRYKLSDYIDGITGATLSVKALKKVATLALFCHSLSPYAQVPYAQSTEQ